MEVGLGSRPWLGIRLGSFLPREMPNPECTPLDGGFSLGTVRRPAILLKKLHSRAMSPWCGLLWKTLAHFEKQ